VAEAVLVGVEVAGLVGRVDVTAGVEVVAAVVVEEELVVEVLEVPQPVKIMTSTMQKTRAENTFFSVFLLILCFWCNHDCKLLSV